MVNLIDLYKVWVKKGKLPTSGLCWNIPKEYKEELRLFSPTGRDLTNIWCDGISTTYWANDRPYTGNSFEDIEISRSFNQFRQTIVLFICAMRNEAISRNGNDSKLTPTGKTYTDTKGNRYPVFITKNGKLLVVKESKATGKKYRYYLKAEKLACCS